MTSYEKKLLLAAAKQFITDSNGDLLQRMKDVDLEAARSLFLKALEDDYKKADSEPYNLQKFGARDNHYNCSCTLYNTSTLATGIPLDNGRVMLPSRSSPSSLFDKLPLEIRRRVLDDVDLESLTILRSLSSHLRNDIDGLPKYAFIVKNASTTLRGVLVTGSGSHHHQRAPYALVCESTLEV